MTNEEKAKSEQLRSIRIQLEESRSTFSANTSRGRVLDALMEQKRKGMLTGIFGRLGDLGAIDEKYDGAISTACGPLDHIVVDSVDTAQKCIQHLKQTRLGIASFIALDKQVHPRPSFTVCFCSEFPASLQDTDSMICLLFIASNT